MMPNASSPIAVLGDVKTHNLSKVANLCDSIVRWVTLGLVILVPLFFLPWTIEVAEINKQLLLLFGTAIAALAWLGKMLAERKVEYRRSIVNLMVVLFLAIYALSAWTSGGKYMSLVGDFGQEKAGLVTVVAFVLLYFIVLNITRTVKDLQHLIFSLVLGGFFVALYSLLQGLGVFLLPFEFTKLTSFNPIGTTTALGFYLAFIMTIANGLLLTGHSMTSEQKKKTLLYKVFLVVTSLISLFIVAAVNFWPLSVAVLVSSFLLIAFAFVHAKSLKGINGILLPVAALVVILLGFFFRFPFTIKYPAEVMPSLKASVDIAVKTLRENPFLGSGPGTFIFNYSKFHVAEINLTAFWDVRFDRSASRFLTLLTTTGLLGALSWLMMAIFLLVSAGRKLLHTQNEETWHLLIGIFAAWVLLVVAKMFYSSNLTLEFVFWVIMAVLVVVHRREVITLTFESSPRAAMIVSFFFIVSVVFTLTGLFVEGQRYAAEIAYANAIRMDRAGGQRDQVIGQLSRAVDLNKSNDVYLRNLALAFLVKADDELSHPVQVDKKKDEKNDEYEQRVESARQEQLKKITDLTAAAVNAGKYATEINGKNVANWSVLASIYQSLSGVTSDASDWAEKAYQKAIELEPANPTLQTELGKIYLYESDAMRPETQSKDEKVKKDAEKKVNDLLVKAVDSLKKAIVLKQDYAPAHYNLALVFDRQGKLKDAIVKMEAVVAYNAQDIGVSFQLALLYYRDGRKDDAFNMLQSVVKRAPNFSNARWYLAAMYEEKGNFDKAIVELNKVLQLNPDSEIVKKKLDELQQKKGNPALSGGSQLPAPVDQTVQNPNEPGVKR